MAVSDSQKSNVSHKSVVDVNACYRVSIVELKCKAEDKTLFTPFTPYIRRKVCATFHIPFGGKVEIKGLLGEKCTNRYVPRPVDGDGNCFFRAVSYLLVGSECEHNIVQGSIVAHIISLSSWSKLSQYILPSYKSGMDYITDKQMADQGKWVTKVEIFVCAQIMGKDIVVYMLNGWQWYKAKRVSGQPTKHAIFLANEHRYHFDPVVCMDCDSLSGDK